MSKTLVINYITKNNTYDQVEYPFTSHFNDDFDQTTVDILNIIIKDKVFLKKVDLVTEAFISEE